MDENKIWYKIVDFDKGQYKTLFHGINRSRVLKFGEWLEADIKPVKDGTSKTTYISGWHLFSDYEYALAYLKFFKHTKKKRIVKCRAKNIWSKEHSRSDVYLAERIFIEEEYV